MSHLYSLLGLDAVSLNPARAAAVVEAEARVNALEGRCSVLLTLLNSELRPKGYVATVGVTGTVHVEPAEVIN